MANYSDKFEDWWANTQCPPLLIQGSETAGILKRFAWRAWRASRRWDNLPEQRKRGQDDGS